MWGRSVLLLVILCAVCTAVEAMQRDGNSNTNGNSHSNTDSVDGPLRSLFDNSVSFLRKEIQQLFRDDSATVVSVTNSKDSSGVISINKEKTRNSADGSVNAYNSDDNYDSYYSTINPSATNEELKLQLQQLTYNHTVYTYDDVWIAFEEIDKYLYNYPCDADPAHIPDVYSAYCWETDKNVTTGGECGNYKKEGDCYNREHLWPKSWFGGFDYGQNAQTDLFELWPSDGYVNGLRGNLPLGEVVPGTATYVSTSGCIIGTCNISVPVNGNSHKYSSSRSGDKKSRSGKRYDEEISSYYGPCFEPTDEYKGDFARAYFYLSTTYYNKWDCCDTDGVNASDIKPWMESMLRQWHVKDPVHSLEIDRNNVIYNNWQHNRNPFIDHPEWVDQIADF